MAQLSLALLGAFSATLGGEPLSGFRSVKTQALLAFLAVEADQPHPRARLAGLLWPDAPERSARLNLRQALFHLRSLLGNERVTPPFLRSGDDAVQFDPDSPAQVDAMLFAEL
ncbi:MAG TPA: hypothetical protein PKE45_01665, partial [Caldilineaceae bacterium]|nr:hypothetical protein [Caldilineaceae bacterium]